MKILILGASGYIGQKLAVRLLNEGRKVRCLSRSGTGSEQLSQAGAEIVTGDILHPESLERAFDDIEVVYYLIHSMGTANASFEELDRRAAENCRKLAEKAGVKRIIYLGGLGRRDQDQSPHLRSRHEVGDVLRNGKVPVTEFRAAVIVGSGSFSFEMIHHLVNRLPMMVCPRWVYTRTQPIGVEDVLAYLTAALDQPESAGKTIDIGGPEVLSYYDMMTAVSEILGLRRYMFGVPVLTPRLSSYWVKLVTPVSIPIARALVESLRHETICENDIAKVLFDIEPISFRESANLALEGLRRKNGKDTPGSSPSPFRRIEVDRSHLLKDVQKWEVAASSQTVFNLVSSIGGDNGWFYADWLWRLRGGIDQVFGGVGLRRGRRDPLMLNKGETLDFWRVEDIVAGNKILLRAEMKVWGKAWLEFVVKPLTENRSELTQSALYYPRGILGFFYWYGIYPIHYFVFRGLIREIARRAEAAERA